MVRGSWRSWREDPARAVRQVIAQDSSAVSARRGRGTRPRGPAVPVRVRSPSRVSSRAVAPSRRSSRRSQRAASSITWLETSSVVPRVGERRGTARHRSRRSTGSSPTVGSSSTSSSGSPSRAAASDTRARWPPESRPTTTSRVAAEADLVEHPVERRRGDAEHAPRSSAGSRARSGRRRPTAPGSRSRPGGAARGDPAGRPSTRTSPPATTWTPTSARIRVILPQPLGPSRPVTEPARDLERDAVEDDRAPTADAKSALSSNRRLSHSWESGRCLVPEGAEDVCHCRLGRDGSQQRRPRMLDA